MTLLESQEMICKEIQAVAGIFSVILICSTTQ